MSEILRQVEFAAALGVTSASIAMALRNKKLIRREDKTYDIDDPTNQLWIRDQIALGKNFEMTKVYEKRSNQKYNRITPPGKKRQVYKLKEVVVEPKPKPEPKKTEPTKKPKPKPKPKTEKRYFTTSDEEYIQKKRALDLKQAQNRVKLDELKIKKIEGALIPFDAVKSVFMYAVETFRSTYMQEVDALTNIYIKILGGDQVQYAELQKDLQEKINAIQKQVKSDLMQGIDSIQKEYSEVRSRGERK